MLTAASIRQCPGRHSLVESMAEKNTEGGVLLDAVGERRNGVPTIPICVDIVDCIGYAACIHTLQGGML